MNNTTELRPIIVEEKSVYGNDFFYPKCSRAKALCSMLGTKTLPDRVFFHLEALGFKAVYFYKSNPSKYGDL